jgi:molybdopterin-binding protein
VKLSARNQLKGKSSRQTGREGAHVRIDIGGQIVTASITNEAADEMKLCTVLNREQLMALYDAPVEKITDATSGVSAFLPG